MGETGLESRPVPGFVLIYAQSSGSATAALVGVERDRDCSCRVCTSIILVFSITV
jgi:hypothetical protein